MGAVFQHPRAAVFRGYKQRRITALKFDVSPSRTTVGDVVLGLFGLCRDFNLTCIRGDHGKYIKSAVDVWDLAGEMLGVQDEDDTSESRAAALRVLRSIRATNH